MRVLLSIFIMGAFSISVEAQHEPVYDFNAYKESAISVGYLYSFGEPHSKSFHLLDFRFEKSRFGGRHPNFINWSSGVILSANTTELLFAPVVGSRISYGGIVTGIDLFYLTNTEEGTLRLAPVLGFGAHKVQIAIQPHIRISNKSFEPISRGHFVINMKLFSLKKQTLH